MIVKTILDDIFPHDPQIVSVLLGGAEKQEAKYQEIVSNLYKNLPSLDLSKVVPTLYRGLIQVQEGNWRIQHLVRELIQKPEFEKYDPEDAQEIPHPLIRTSAEERGCFPREKVRLSDMGKRVQELRGNNFFLAKQLSETMRLDEKADQAEGKRLTKENVPCMGAPHNATLKWNEGLVCGQRFGLGGLPKTFDELSVLLLLAIQNKDCIIVSLHETGEHAEDRVSDFWEPNQLKKITIPHFTIQQGPGGQKVLMSRPYPSEYTSRYSKEMQIVKTPLEVRHMDGLLEASHNLIHFHLDGWPDARALPSIEPFYRLLSEIRSVRTPSPNPTQRILIHCIGGVGRTGTLTVALALMDYIDAQLAQGKPLGEIEVNIPELIYNELRRIRPGAIGQYVHLIHLYEIVDMYFRELSERMTTTTSSTTTTKPL